MSDQIPSTAAQKPSAARVDPELVAAALSAAEALGCGVAEVPLTVIAETAGISRSTLWRRLGGAREVLDEAVRAAGVEPGGQAPVRTRAVDAAAALISESGLAATTMEAIAHSAGCSVYSLYAAFGGRDELMRAVFERHSPIRDLEDYLAGEHGNLNTEVRGFMETMARSFEREPRLAPAILSEIFARPSSPAVRKVTAYTGPRILGILNLWLEREIRAGRIRDLPRPLLAQQLLGPITLHLLTRPAAPDTPDYPKSDIDTVCTVFANAFIRSAAVSPAAD